MVPFPHTSDIFGRGTAVASMPALASRQARVFLALFASVATAQADYRLVITPELGRTTAVSDSRSYGDANGITGTRGFYRDDFEYLYRPGGWPALVLDTADGLAVGHQVAMWYGRSYALIWHADGSVTVTHQSVRHASINGTNGTVHVGWQGDPETGTVMACKWDDSSSHEAEHWIYPTDAPGWPYSVAEDVSDEGVIVGTAREKGDVDRAVVWVGEREVRKLPSPSWATIQTRGVGIGGTWIVGDATGDQYTRPLAWVDGEPVVLADMLGMAIDVNADGVAVGWVSTGLGSYGAVWNLPDAEPIDLNLWAPRGVVIIAAYCVSPGGDIGVQCSVGGEAMGGVLVRRDMGTTTRR